MWELKHRRMRFPSNRNHYTPKGGTESFRKFSVSVVHLKGDHPRHKELSVYL